MFIFWIFVYLLIFSWLVQNRLHISFSIKLLSGTYFQRIKSIPSDIANPWHLVLSYWINGEYSLWEAVVLKKRECYDYCPYIWISFLYSTGLLKVKNIFNEKLNNKMKQFTSNMFFLSKLKSYSIAIYLKNIYWLPSKC